MAAFDTIFPADTVEFCPHPDALDILVCGTYKLDDPSLDHQARATFDSGGDTIASVPQHRRGQCLVFEVDPPQSAGDRHFRQIQAFDMPAVLDMKWCHRSQSKSAVLGVADSEGNITLHEWQETERVLKQIDSIRCASADTLCLSLDWSNRRYTGSDLGSLTVSLSNGFLGVLRPNDGHGLTMVESWHAHDYEPWIAAWNYWDTSVVYSGGDDLKMKGWDMRQGFSHPLFVNKRFDAGVTSIQSHPHIEHLIAVGSYNNSVKLFDTRKPLIPLTEVDVGGGAWRVKWNPSSIRKNDLLVACMHDGFKVVTFKLDVTGKENGKVVKRFDAHTSLAYGADWSSEILMDDETLIGSCSFYDHAFHLWSG